MVQNPHVASGKFNCMNGREKLNGSWEELVKQLNNLRNPGIKEKDIKSWKEVSIELNKNNNTNFITEIDGKISKKSLK